MRVTQIDKYRLYTIVPNLVDATTKDSLFPTLRNLRRINLMDVAVESWVERNLTQNSV